MTDKKTIAVLGAGFGGLKAAFDLSRLLKQHALTDRYEITLIDRNAYHTYTPTLYEIATTSKDTTDYIGLKHIVAFEIIDLIKKSGINFLKAEVKELDVISGSVHLTNGTNLKFHHLVLAPGSEINYFGIPGLKENSSTLKTFVDALKIRDKIVAIASSEKKQIRIVIGGGGSAGVELAGELQGWLRELKQEIRSCDSEVFIIEAGPTILPGFEPRLINYAQNRLKKLKVKILNNETIERVQENKIILKSRTEIPFDVLIWTGGVKASSLISSLPFKIERRGRMEVAEGMECLPQSPDLKLYGKIYGLGDSVCFYDPLTKKPIPGVARAAIEQAKVVAHNIICDILSKPEHKKYHPINYPYVIPVGGKWAVAKIGPFIIRGFFGWVLKGLVELNYLLSIMPPVNALKIWIRGLLIFIKNDRLG